jgi:hypothetical protein
VPSVVNELTTQYAAGAPSQGIRYTLKIVSKIVAALFLITITANLGIAEETSFRRVHVPVTVKGKHIKQVKAVLAFSDEHHAIEVYPAKGNTVSIPYSDIDKVSYEFTKKHRVNDATIITAPIVIGGVMMITLEKLHWLQIDYRQQDVPQSFVVRMDKKNYIRILDAVRNHTGKDAEVLGNADKR